MTTIAERGQFPHVLLVEDNKGDATLITLAFRKAEYPSKISTAETGEAALAMLAREGQYALAAAPDIILLDLNLPRMHGLEFLKRIKSDPRLALIPVIVLSSSDAESDMAASYLGHAAGFVTKPICLDDYDEIVATLGTYWFKIMQTVATDDIPDEGRPIRTGT